MILDYHFSEFSSEILLAYSADAIVKTRVDLGTQSLLLYAKDHWSHCHFNTQRFRRPPAVPADLLGDLLQSLREHGIGINAYYSVAWDETSARLHPDWYSLDKLDEVVSRYRFEALFLNTFGSLPVCYCEACRKLWRARTGSELPRILASEDLARYTDFQIEEILGTYYDQVLALLERHNLNIPATHNAELEYSRDGYVAAELNPYGADFLRSDWKRNFGAPAPPARISS